MSPFEVLSIGHKVWEIGNEIYEKYNDHQPEKRDNFTESSSGVAVQKWKHFDEEEFSCPCCGDNRISRNLVDRLDFAREISGLPMRVSSGYRCRRHNKKVKGKPRSSHLDGSGCDIICPSGAIKATFLASFFESGIRRIGIYKNFIHVDVSEKLPSPMVWIGE
jgi:uncharacterized protein YcbK (DUF882 family)